MAWDHGRCWLIHTEIPLTDEGMCCKFYCEFGSSHVYMFNDFVPQSLIKSLFSTEVTATGGCRGDMMSLAGDQSQCTLSSATDFSEFQDG